MMLQSFRKIARDSDASVAVEFVALMPAFLFLTLFVFEIVLAVFRLGTAEKAAQLGARLAVVSSAAVTGLPNTYVRRSGYVYGQSCSAGACGTDGAGFATKTCAGGTGGDCNSANCLGATVNCFRVIVNRMRDIANVIQPQHVTITYEHVGLGFAGGPIIPRVTLTVQNVPYDTVSASILVGLMSLATGRTDFPGLTVMPTITATFTGEDLSTAGAS